MRKVIFRKLLTYCRSSGVVYLKKILNSWLSWGFIALTLLSFSFVYWFYYPFVAEEDIFVEGIKIGGIPVTGLSAEEALIVLNKRFESYLDESLILIDNGFKFFCCPREWGFSFNYDLMLKDAYALGHSGNVFSQWMERRYIKRKSVENRIIVKPDQDLLTELIRLLEIQVNVEPVKSNLVVNKKGEVTKYPSRTGRQLNIQMFLRELSEVIITPEKKELTLPVDVVKPALVDKEVSRWNLTNIISFFTTEFDDTNEDRTHNLKVAVSHLHGALLPPKQQFSFNRWVGPRDLKAGYREAPVVLDNQLVPGIGGGICQVSTTLYNAWLLAGFYVDKRFNHSLPVTYTKMGRDAAVVYGAQDLVFSNPLKTPVLISALIEDKYLTVALLGKTDARRRYSLESKIVEEIPPPLVRVEDPSLIVGEETMEDIGQTGYKVELWRKAFIDGEEVKNEKLGFSFYKPKPCVIRVGTNADAEIDSNTGIIYSEDEL